MTRGDSMTETEDLRAQLVAALKSRAMTIAALYDAFAAELGEARTAELMSRALHARGAAAGRRMLAGHAPADFAGLRDAFVDFLPDHGRLFDLDVPQCDAQGLAVDFGACPLQAAWHEAGLPAARVEALCAIAGAVDRGVFEGAGFAVSNDTWRDGRTGCCRLRITRRDD